MKNFGVLVLLLLGTGCSLMGVEPWDRDVLARDEMQLTTDALEAASDDHIYFSKQDTRLSWRRPLLSQFHLGQEIGDLQFSDAVGFQMPGSGR